MVMSDSTFSFLLWWLGYLR